jgi:hypothetical protein
MIYGIYLTVVSIKVFLACGFEELMKDEDSEESMRVLLMENLEYNYIP